MMHMSWSRRVEDVGRELVVQFFIPDALYNGKRLAVVDNQTCLDYELFRVQLEQMEGSHIAKKTTKISSKTV